MSLTMWWRMSAVLVFSVCIICASSSDFEEQMKTLSKQVTALLDRRREDLQNIEDNMRRNLFLSPELVDVKEQMQHLSFRALAATVNFFLPIFRHLLHGESSNLEIASWSSNSFDVIEQDVKPGIQVLSHSQKLDKLLVFGNSSFRKAFRFTSGYFATSTRTSKTCCSVKIYIRPKNSVYFRINKSQWPDLLDAVCWTNVRSIPADIHNFSYISEYLVPFFNNKYSIYK